MAQQEIIIRPAEIKDAHDINVMRRMPGIAENILALPSEPIKKNEDFITNRTDDDHLFCAELAGPHGARVVGVAGLHVKKLARHRHCAVLGIMVHKDVQGQSIGKKLMEVLIDLADNWLLLKRIELTVFPTNQIAIALYEKFDFITEGTLKYACVRGGKYEDILLMARYHPSIKE